MKQTSTSTVNINVAQVDLAPPDSGWIHVYSWGYFNVDGGLNVLTFTAEDSSANNLRTASMGIQATNQVYTQWNPVVGGTGETVTCKFTKSTMTSGFFFVNWEVRKSKDEKHFASR